MNNNDLLRLEIFNEKANEMKYSKFYDELVNKKSSVMFSWRLGENPESIKISADSEAVNSVVLSIRMFIQDNDKLSIRNIHKIYSNNQIISILEPEYNSIRENLNIFLSNTSGVSFFENQYSNKDIIDLVIYGDKGHSNLEKNSHIKNIKSKGELVEQLFDYSFDIAIANLIQYIVALSEVNKKAINLIKNNS